MKIAAVIPVHGRLPLVRVTIERLLKKNGVHTVLCAGSTDDEKSVCEKAGATFFFHENQPLGKKWNHLFQRAGDLNPDAVLFVGSSDWVSDNWLPVCFEQLGQYDMVGHSGFYMLDIGKEYRVCYWPGYGPGPRSNEPIGIGRLLGRDILTKIEWKPFSDDAPRSLDHHMFKAVLGKGGKVRVFKDDEIKSLSLSCSLWPNMHIFEDHWSNKLPSTKIYDHNFLRSHFPESFKIFS